MTREERERKESELRELQENMNHQSPDADYHIIQYVSKLAVAMKKAGMFDEISFVEPFDIEEYDTHREAIRARIRELRKELEEAVVEDDNADK